MKVVITGASGFIGTRVLELLVAECGHTIIAAGRSIDQFDVSFERVDLLAPGAGAELMARVRPTHWLHLAWNAKPGVFWTATDNFDWLASSISTLNSFIANGGERAVFAGTCAEYDWHLSGLLHENSKTRPDTFYGICKDELRRCVDLANAELGASLAWGRVFWLYGSREARGRLVADVCASLVRGEPIGVGQGDEVRDFLHVDDVARALVAALHSSFKGAFNIGSGEPVAVREILKVIADISGRPDLIRIGSRPSPANLVPFLVADNRILTDELGWHRTIPLKSGLETTYVWWKEQSVR